MTMEQIGLLFDTGRKGDADAAAAAFDGGPVGKEAAMLDGVDDDEKQQSQPKVAHRE